MRIAAVGKAFPPHYYPQSELVDELQQLWRGRHRNVERLEALHRNTMIAGRHLALPRGEYAALATFGQANDAFLRIAPELAASAARQASDRSGMALDRVSLVVSTTVTGVAVPSLDALVMNRLGLGAHVKRSPLFGLGCVGGVAAVARAADYLRGHPQEVALVLAVELCSLTLQKDDLTLSNVIAAGLFGDGAAAVLVSGDAMGPAAAESAAPGASPTGPRVVGTRSVFYPWTERMMGWDVSEHGFRIVLSPEVPHIVRARLGGDVDVFLADHALTRRDIAAWIPHPGGPKVLQAVQEALQLPEEALLPAWSTLREAGNLSSVSVLLVLEQVLAQPPAAGSYGVMLAMGPGFCSELILLQW